MVQWDLRNRPAHTQKNLPDPCANLFFDKEGAKVLGPITKTYSYKLYEQGQIVGIKFKPAGLCHFTPEPMTTFTDHYIQPTFLFSHWEHSVPKKVQAADSLDEAVAILEPLLLAQKIITNQKIKLANDIISFIKTSSGINQVQQVTDYFRLNIRTLQRMFERYIGINPKWIIRKYRLHDVLDKAERDTQDWLSASLALGYTEQSHFIKDFKELVGVTPSVYRSLKSQSSD